MVDYPGAQQHLVPRNFMFNSNACKVVVLHKTGGDATPQAVYNTFLASGNPGNSVHYAIGTDGSIWQFVPEALGAGGNGAVEAGYDPFWNPYLIQYGNLNLCTISIEHCDASSSNSTPLTPAQQTASFSLVAYLVKKYSIPIDHIKTHASIDPINRARCPGNYPLTALFAHLQQPQGETYMTIDITNTVAASWYTQDAGGVWHLKSDPTITIHGEILATYKSMPSVGAAGVTELGKPITGEIPLLDGSGKQLPGGATYQVFERGGLVYDPSRALSNPPYSSGPCYKLFIGPYYQAYEAGATGSAKSALYDQVKALIVKGP